MFVVISYRNFFLFLVVYSVMFLVIRGLRGFFMFLIGEFLKCIKVKVLIIWYYEEMGLLFEVECIFGN